MGFIEIIIKNAAEFQVGYKMKQKLQIYKWSRKRKNAKRTKRPESTDRKISEPWADETTLEIKKELLKQISHKIKETKEELAEDLEK